MLTVWIAYKTARMLKNGYAYGLWVLAFFAISFKHAETAHYAVSDSLVTFFCALAAYFFAKIVLNPSGQGDAERHSGTTSRSLTKHSVVNQSFNSSERCRTIKTGFTGFLAVSIACAASCKINVGGILGISAAIGLWAYGIANASNIHNILLQTTRLALVFATAFVALNLPYFLCWEKWLHVIQIHITDYPYTIKGGFATFFYFKPPFGVGLPIVIMALIGLLPRLARWRTSKTNERVFHFFAGTFLCLFYLYLATSRGVIHRWAIPLTPFLVLFAARFAYDLQQLATRFFNSRKWANVLAITCFFAIGFVPLRELLHLNLALGNGSDTYEQAKSYLKSKALKNGQCAGNYEGMALSQCPTRAPESVEALESSDIDYLVFTDFWFSSRRYPAHILYQKVIDERAGGTWEPLRAHVEQYWRLDTLFTARFYSSWSTNVAQPARIWVYGRR